MTRSLVAPMLCIAMLFAAGAARAQQSQLHPDVPAIISYQGLLSSVGGGTVADGNHRMTFSLYADSSGSVLVWRDQYSVHVAAGVFNVQLGSGRFRLPAPGAMNQPLWIGTTLDDAAEMRPLTRLTSTPYAINVADGAITTEKLAPGAVTPEKISADYVSAVSVNGEKISGAGTPVNLTGSNGVSVTFDSTSNSVQFGLANQAAQHGQKDGKGGATPQAAGDYAWRLGGDVVDNAFNGVTIPASPANWIGTSSATNSARRDFTIKVSSVQTMKYQAGSISTPCIIGGDASNAIDVASVWSIVAGGTGNKINAPADESTISGGISNIIDQHDANSVIGGGSTNKIYGVTDVDVWTGNNVIGGGISNRIGNTGDDVSNHSEMSTIGGGNSNSINNTANGTIGGGFDNTVESGGGTIAGGDQNHIYTTSDDASIGGGTANVIKATAGVIGGGGNSLIDVSAIYGTIAGGHSNQISKYQKGGTIAGGYDNVLAVGATTSADYTEYQTVSGGTGHRLYPLAGGATVGGGYSNIITAAGSVGTIPGGEYLQAQSYAQTVIGAFNNPRGSVPFRNGGNVMTSNDPLFIIGNGYITSLATFRSNAFEVSYNGHSVVYGRNGGSVPAIRGATYTDNVIYAWGEVTLNGGAACNNSFGVTSVTRKAQGWYRVVLSLANPDDPTNPKGFSLTCSSVTATLSSGAGPTNAAVNICQTIATSRVGNIPSGGGTVGFDVYISEHQIKCDPVHPELCPTLECKPADCGFFFKVTGTPSTP